LNLFSLNKSRSASSCIPTSIGSAANW
jgi:hypothetical protein